MDMAARIKLIKPSVTLTLSAKTKTLLAQGIDVINLTAGEPDFDTPDFVKEAAFSAIREGQTKYTPTSGIPELKEAIIDKLKIENHLIYDPSEIIVTCGAKQSLYNAFQALIDSDDEVLIISPFWVTYPEQVHLCMAHPIVVPSREKEAYQVKIQDLETSVTSKTKALILNSPCNPSGATYDPSFLEEVADFALRSNLWVISDEIYEPFVYDGFRHVSIASLSESIKKRTLVINGVSKAYAMTGWRIGYTAGPRQIVTAMDTIQSQSTSNPPSISQWASVAALRKGKPFTTKMVTEFDRRRRHMVHRLNQLPGFSCSLPRGSFYVFPNVSSLLARTYRDKMLRSPSDVADFLLEEAKVLVVPGEPFGGQEHLRLSYAVSMEDIDRALDRIQKALTVLD